MMRQRTQGCVLLPLEPSSLTWGTQITGTSPPMWLPSLARVRGSSPTLKVKKRKDFIQQIGVIPEFILKKGSCVVLVGRTAQAQTVRKNIRFRHTYD